MSKRAKKRAYAKKMKEREKQFDMRFTLGKLPKYNGLYDKNLRHHFENRRIQSHLANLGLIDSEGRVVDLDKAKGKGSHNLARVQKRRKGRRDEDEGRSRNASTCTKETSRDA